MSAIVNVIEGWSSKVVVVAAWVAGVNAKSPIACVPSQWAVEICSLNICTILPIIEYIAQICISMCPVCPVEVIYCVDTHEVIQINLVCCFVLCFSQIQLVSHLIAFADVQSSMSDTIRVSTIFLIIVTFISSLFKSGRSF